MLIPAFQDAIGEPDGDGWLKQWLGLFIFLAVLVLPFVIGQFIANRLKLKDLGFKMGVVLFAITLGLSPFVNEIVRGNSWKDAIPLGIDLAGGANMVFVVDHEQIEMLDKTLDTESMERMVSAIKRRIDPSNTEEITVGLIPPDRIEVIVPGVDPEKVTTGRKTNTVFLLITMISFGLPLLE